MSRMSIFCTLSSLIFLTSPTIVSAQRFAGKSVAEWNQALDSQSGTLRRNAAFSLGKLGGAASVAIPKLTKLLSDDNDQIREAAAYAIGEIVQESVVANDDPTLLTTLLTHFNKEEQRFVRRSLAFALGSMGPAAEKAIPDLEKAIGDPKANKLVRQNAAWALGRIGAKGIGGLKLALADSDILVQRDAAKAIAEFDVETGRKALDGLLACCKSSDGEVKKTALQVLTKLLKETDQNAISPIAAVLSQSKDPEIRLNASLALSNIGGDKLMKMPIAKTAVRTLHHSLLHGSIDERKQAAVGLRKFGPIAGETVNDLRKMLKDKNADLHQYAALALGGMGMNAKTAVPDLAAIVGDPNEFTESRVRACVALSEIGKCEEAAKIIGTLVKVLRNPKAPPDVRSRLYWALMVHEGTLPDYPGVLEAFEFILDEPARASLSPKDAFDTRLIRYNAAYLLGLFKKSEVSPKVLDVLLQYLKDDKISLSGGSDTSVKGGGVESGKGGVKVQDQLRDDARISAVDALSKIGAGVVRTRPDIIKQLRVLSQDKNTTEEVRKSAAALVEAAGG